MTEPARPIRSVADADQLQARAAEGLDHLIAATRGAFAEVPTVDPTGAWFILAGRIAVKAGTSDGNRSFCVEMLAEAVMRLARQEEGDHG